PVLVGTTQYRIEERRYSSPIEGHNSSYFSSCSSIVVGADPLARHGMLLDRRGGTIPRLRVQRAREREDSGLLFRAERAAEPGTDAGRGVAGAGIGVGAVEEARHTHGRARLAAVDAGEEDARCGGVEAHDDEPLLGVLMDVLDHAGPGVGVQGARAPLADVRVRQAQRFAQAAPARERI